MTRFGGSVEPGSRRGPSRSPRDRPAPGLAFLLLLLSVPAPAEAQDRFGIEAFLGTAVNAPASLTLRQDGEADLSFNAKYETRPLRQPVYWSVRVTWLRPRTALELQFTHDKLYLTNPPPDVQHFEVTHGFNLLTLAHRWRFRPVDLRLGGGIVLPHPDGTVRDRAYDSPKGGLLGREWHTVGPALLLGLGKRWEPVTHLWLSADAELSAAWANRVPVNAGSVDMSNFALHLRVGVGYGS